MLLELEKIVGLSIAITNTIEAVGFELAFAMGWGGTGGCTEGVGTDGCKPGQSKRIYLFILG